MTKYFFRPGFTGKGHLAGKGEIEGAAKAIKITPDIGRPAIAGNLGGNVIGSAGQTFGRTLAGQQG